MEWPRLMQMNWPSTSWLKTDRDVADSAEEIRTAMSRNPPTNDELCATIRWMAGPEGKQEKPPSLRELIRAVFIRRKSARTADAPVGEVCPVCRGRGWAEVSPFPARPEYACEVVCLCHRGEDFYARLDEFASTRADAERARRYQEWRQLAQAQWRERARAKAGVAA